MSPSVCDANVELRIAREIQTIGTQSPNFAVRMVGFVNKLRRLGKMEETRTIPNGEKRHTADD